MYKTYDKNIYIHLSANYQFQYTFQAMEKQQQEEEEKKRNSQASTVAFRVAQHRSICASCCDTAQPCSHCCYDDSSTPLYAAASMVETRRRTFPNNLSHGNHQSRICAIREYKHCHWWRHWTPALCNVPVRARARQSFRLVGPVWRHEMTQAASPMAHKNAGIRKSSRARLLPVAADSFDAAADQRSRYFHRASSRE